MPTQARKEPKSIMKKFPVAAVAMLTLAGCATISESRSETALRIARGPCFGFCPVYDIATAGRDHVRFQGIRHTAVLGETVKPVGRAAVAGLVERLAPYRPRSGSPDFVCPQETSDQAEYTIIWQTPGSADRAALTFNSGCQSANGRALKSILEGAPAQLGFEEESRQVTRPGSPRG